MVLAPNGINTITGVPHESHHHKRRRNQVRARPAAIAAARRLNLLSEVCSLIQPNHSILCFKSMHSQRAGTNGRSSQQ